MSQLDSELHLLRLRLAALEEQKRAEEVKAAEQKAFPLTTLENIVDSYNNIKRGTSSFQQERYNYAKEKLSFLAPILDALKDIQARLEALENKSI
jgi:hypothetical protein